MYRYNFKLLQVQIITSVLHNVIKCFFLNTYIQVWFYCLAGWYAQLNKVLVNEYVTFLFLSWTVLLAVLFINIAINFLI